MADIRIIPFLVSEVRLEPDEQVSLGREWWPSYAHAVLHRDGVFLFDNGCGLGNVEIDAVFTPRVIPIERALAEHGIAMTDLTGIANCHLHFDHAGQNARLPPGIPIFVQRREWAMVHEPDYTVPEWIDVPGLRYEVIDGEAGGCPGSSAGADAGPQSRSPVAPGWGFGRDRGGGRPGAPVASRMGGRDRSGVVGSAGCAGTRLRGLGPATPCCRSRSRALRPRPLRLGTEPRAQVDGGRRAGTGQPCAPSWLTVSPGGG